MESKAKVLIVGAGLGGLTAAACLLRLGFRVRVLEQASLLGEVGAGIQTSANAVKVLDHLGLRPALEKLAVRPAAFEFRRFDTGEQVGGVPLGEQHERSFGAPYYHTHRADLHQLLAQKVLELDPACLSLNTKVHSFEESADGVTVHLQGGNTVQADVLVGADGIKSVVRQQILGDTPVSYTGDIAWRALIPVERLPERYMERVVTVWCGPQKHLVLYYVRGGRLLNFGGCVERAFAEGESWTQRRPWEELKKDFDGWHPDVQTAIDAIDKDSCFQWALNNRAPVDNWSTERSTLLGDAAHPTLPYMAQGAVMAIEDGAVLARCLDSEALVPLALQKYQRNRIDRTARIVRESTSMRSLYRIEDEEEMRRTFAQRNLAKSRGEWLYNYDALTVPLA